MNVHVFLPCLVSKLLMPYLFLPTAVKSRKFRQRWSMVDVNEVGDGFPEWIHSDIDSRRGWMVSMGLIASDASAAICDHQYRTHCKSRLKEREQVSSFSA